LGNSEINNAVYVSYLEILPLKGDVHDRIRIAMTSDLRQAWDDILDYLSKVSKKIGACGRRTLGIWCLCASFSRLSLSLLCASSASSAPLR
jgi:hypothetical protein